MKRKKSEIVDGAEFFQDFSYIDDQKVFEDFVDELLLDERVGIDTEFHRERTYFPSVALVQIAHTKGISLIDPLKVDLRGLSKLLNSQVLIVMHAASQDLEVFQHACGVVPKRLFDTQVAAGFLGMSTPSLSALYEKQLGILIKKESRLTDWMARPLSASQLEYAANDVRYLLQVYDQISTDLEDRGRVTWVEAECSILLEKEKRRRIPEEAWKKIKEGKNLRGNAQNNIRALAAWRETKAAKLNIPVRYVFPDIALVAIAQQEPKNLNSLEAIRGVETRHLKNSFPKEIFAELKLAKELEPLPKKVKQDQDKSKDLRAGVALVSAWITQAARQLDLDPAILGTRSDVEALVRGDSDARMSMGWRNEIVGESVKELLKGEAALAFDGEAGLVLESRKKR
ncbi:MAG: HRDC domain-containing protein [Acidimicrobiales bacterium]|nr:HRDC domain-containing protein [Acidimicrobiales bacterium]